MTARPLPRRSVLPLLFLALTVTAGAGAVAAGPPGLPDRPPVELQGARAPVLSARRVPTMLVEPVARRRLRSRLDGVAGYLTASSCLVVTDHGRSLYGVSPEAPVIPASAQKLATAAAVLHHLGPDERLRTTVVATDEPGGDGVVTGDLWLVGGGDPVLATADWAARADQQPALFTPLEELADRLVEAGVRRVEGAVRGDESRYDDLRYVASWPSRYAATGEVGPLSALTVNDGFDTRASDRPFADPAAGAARVLADLLRQRGVVVVAEAAPPGRAPDGAGALASVDSPTMDRVVGRLLSESDNGSAELLLKELGARVSGEGSTGAGIAVVADTLEELGVPMAGVHLVDGSGLDRGNTLTCGALTAILDLGEEDGPVDEGLAVAGVSGTLAERFEGTVLAGRLRGKTGYLNGVAALAGHVVATSGDRLTFAIVVNGTAGLDGAIALQAAVGEALITHPDAPDPADLGPGAH